MQLCLGVLLQLHYILANQQMRDVVGERGERVVVQLVVIWQWQQRRT